MASTAHEISGSSSTILTDGSACCAGGHRQLRVPRIDSKTEDGRKRVRDIFSDQTVLAGFYDYGEIAPFTGGNRYEFHNPDHEHHHIVGAVDSSFSPGSYP